MGPLKFKLADFLKKKTRERSFLTFLNSLSNTDLWSFESLVMFQKMIFGLVCFEDKEKDKAMPRKRQHQQR